MTGPVKLPRAYWYVWSAGLASSLGDGFAIVGLPLLAHSLTGDARLITLLFAAQRLPWLLFSVLTGSFVDRRSPRRVAVWSDLIRGGVLLALVSWYFIAELSVPVLLAVAFLLGLAETAHSAASQAMIPLLLRDERLLAKGNGYLFTAQVTGEQMAGPAIGGWVFGFSTVLPFVGDAASFLLSAVLVRRVRLVEATRESQAPSMWLDIRLAIRWFRQDSLLVVTTVLTALASFGQGMVLSVLVIFAVDDLSISKAGYGVLVSVIALGNVLGGLAAHHLLKRVSLLTVNGGGVALMGLLYVVAASNAQVVLAAACLLVEGFIVAVLNVNNRTLRQSRIPPELIGKVVNLIRTLVLGAAPLGALVAGAIAQSSSATRALFFAGIGLTLMSAVMMPSLVRAIRAETRMDASPALTSS